MILHRKIRLGLLSVTLFASPFAFARDPQPPTALPIEQMRAAVYTKEFAKRFALPEPQPDTEPEGGMQAMEFAVEENPNAPYYYCKLYLYFDNKLPIAYPEGETGIAYLPSRRTQLMTFDAQTRWLRLSEKDRLHFNERKGRYTRMTMLASPGYEYPELLSNPPKKPYGGIGMFYDEYHRDLFPGIAYLKIDMGCPVFSWMDGIETVEVWLKREGAKDYRTQNRMEPQDFLKITIPSRMYRKILNWRKEISAYNESITKKLDTERRNRN